MHDQDWLSLGNLAQDILRICREAKTAQSDWLQANGLTMSQARLLPIAEQTKLQKNWAEYYDNRHKNNALFCHIST